MAATARRRNVDRFALPLRLPHAEVSSEAATHAPRASFHMLLYDLFIYCSARGEWIDGFRSTKNAMPLRQVPSLKARAWECLDYRNAGMYGLVYISVRMPQ